MCDYVMWYASDGRSGVLEWIMAREEQPGLPNVPEPKSKTWALGESHGFMCAMQRRCSMPSQVVAFWSVDQLSQFRDGYEAGYSRGRQAMAVQG